MLTSQIWKGRASLMVGAGLSANAEPHVSGSKRLPLWKDLHQMLKKALYGNLEDNSISGADSFLKLAQEFRDYHGDVKLDEFIKSQIDTGAFDPSKYHKELLELEWSNVFTTNYDDLLERTRVFNRHYSLVRTVQEIASSSRPRIVKLHGSLPSGPFVFTEEDYRTYPKRFAPFVNMVQQAIVETTMCLIGFSGDDPNFLSWTGWVNDNLGKNRNPVFLIGDLQLSQSKRKYLESKFVFPLDFAPVIPETVHGEDRHRRAVEMFLSYVKYFSTIDDNDWPLVETNRDLPNDWVPVISVQKEKYHRKPLISLKDLEINDLPRLFEELKQERLTYPGWVAIPHKTRMKQIDKFINLMNAAARKLQNLERPADLLLTRELLWRLDVLLFPVPSELLPSFLAIVEHYDSSSGQGDGKDETEKSDWLSQDYSGMIFENWIQVLLSLMKATRVNGRETEFIKIQNELEPLINDHLDWEQRWFFEKAMFELHFLRITDLKRTLKRWPECSIPIWVSRKASLIALYGDVESAIELSATAVRLLSSEIHKTSAANSEASFVLATSRFIRSARDIMVQKDEFALKGIEPIDEMRGIFMDLQAEILESLEKELKAAEGLTIRFSLSVEKSLLYATEYVLLSEEGAVPLKLRFMNSIGAKANQGALQQLAEYFPVYAVLKSLQALDEKGIDELLSTQLLLNIRETELKTIAEAIFHYIESSLKEPIPHHRLHLANSMKVLSKICFRIGTQLTEKGLSLLVKTYYCETLNNMQNFPLRELNDCLFSLLEACDKHIALETIKKSLTSPLAKKGFTDIITIAAGARPELMRNMVFAESELGKLIELVNNNPASAMGRVATLMEFGKLESKGVFSELAQIFWRDLDQSMKPKSIKRLEKLFRIPEPSPGTACELVKKELLGRKIPSLWEKQENTINFREKGSSTLLWQLINSTKYPGLDEKTLKISWESDEAKIILCKLAHWWFSQRENLLCCLSSIGEEGIIRLFEDSSLLLLKETLKRVIMPFLGNDCDDSWTEITSILLDLQFDGIPILDAIPHYIRLGGRENYVMTELEKGLLSYDEEVALSAIQGVVEWARYYDNLSSIPVRLLRQLLSVAENRSGKVLCTSIQAITSLHDDFFAEKQYSKDLDGILYRARSSSSINSKYPKRLIDQAVEIAEAGSSLAMKMNQTADFKGTEIGQEVAAWKEFSESSIFPSVRNIWKDNY